MSAKPAKKTNYWKIALPIALLFLLACFCLVVIALLVFFGYQGSGPLRMLATATHTPSPTATFTPTRTATRTSTRTPTRTFTATPITDLSGEWELTLTVTEVIPGGGISPSDPCVWYATLTHYLSLTQYSDGSLEATYYLTTDYASATYPLAGYFDGYYFNLTSSASGGSCDGSIIIYEGILVGDILSGSKYVDGYTEGACCGYVGDFIGVRLP